MKNELKEQIIDRIRREHNISIKKGDPLFAMVTANEIIIEEQLKELIRIFSDQRIETEVATQNYLNKAKTLLEQKLSYLLKEIQSELHSSKKDQAKTKDKNTNYRHPLLLITIGAIIGYTIALFVL